MEAVVLEKANDLRVRKIDLPTEVGPNDVRIKMHTVGICGSDVHIYKHGGIGIYALTAPMVLGHEGSGTVVEVGGEVGHLKVGDRVCMEPGVPPPGSRALREGFYNIEPEVLFWATPPVHGCLTPFVVHPAAFTFKLPDNLSYAEGALVEPLSVGVHAATRAQIRPGDIACVLGGGTIGVMCTVAALAAGCTRVIVCDVMEEKLQFIAKHLPPNAVTVCNVSGGKEKLVQVVNKLTGGWGCNVVFEASGSPKTLEGVHDLLCLRGCLVIVGVMPAKVELDLAALQFKEARIEPTMRYCNTYPRAIELMASGKVDLKPFITRTFPFKESVKAFDEMAAHRPSDVKIQIVL